MRISEILFQFLIEHQKLNLPTIGVLILKTPFTLEEDDHSFLPEDSLLFIADPATQTDEQLIEAIAKGSGKIKALATADLETFIINGKQMMNISKPFVIDRLGVLERNYLGEIHFLPAKLTTSTTQQGQTKRKQQKEIRFDDNYLLRFKKMGSQYKKIWAPIAGLVVLIMIFWFGYFFFREAIPTAEKPAPTALAVPVKKDSVAPTPTSAPTDTIQRLATDSFFIVVHKSVKDKALVRFADLQEWGHNVQMVTKDSIIFKLRIPIYASLTDSAQHRDSLARFFGRRVWIERQ